MIPSVTMRGPSGGCQTRMLHRCNDPRSGPRKVSAVPGPTPDDCRTAMSGSGRVVSQVLTPVMSRAPAIVFVSLLQLATACSERVPSAPRAVPALTSRVLTCRADVRAGTLSCAPAGATGGVSGVSEISAEAIGRSGSPPQTERILGGQGVYVQLTSSNASYNATTHIFQADVTVQNLIAWPLGTPDGSRLTGVKVFFYSGPSTVAGTGTVFVQNADGSGTFTATNQPYFFYNQILQTEDVSSAKTWEWSVPITVTTFAFEVLVDAAVPPMTIP